jgi:hypothetical protein
MCEEPLKERGVLYGPRLRKIKYTAKTTAGVVMRSTTRRNSAHSHQERSTLIPFGPRTLSSTPRLLRALLSTSAGQTGLCFATSPW